MTKTGKPDKLTIIFGSLLILLLLVSVVLYLTDSNKQIMRKILFYHEETMQLSGEVRAVPMSAEREHNIRSYVQEMLLGPATLRLIDIFPSGTRLNQLQLVGKTLYVDFSREMVFNLENHPLKLVDIKNLVVDNLTMNFPFLEKIEITIDGIEPRFEIEE